LSVRRVERPYKAFKAGGATSVMCNGWTSSASTVRGTGVEASLNASFSYTADYGCSDVAGGFVCVSQ
jgi:hypothetical protein